MKLHCDPDTDSLHIELSSDDGGFVLTDAQDTDSLHIELSSDPVLNCARWPTG